MFDKSSKRGLTICFLFILTMLVQAPQNVSAVLSDGLIGYWPLDEGTGATAADMSGHGNGGVLVNGPTWVTGKIGSALNFNGTNQYVTMDAVANDFSTTTAVTIAAWIKNTETGEGDWFSNNGTNGQYLLCQYGNVQRFYEGGWQPATTPITNNGLWHYVVAVRDSSMYVTIYVDGVNVGGNYTSTVYLDSADRWSLAQEWDDTTPSDFYTGIIDEVAIWDRALSSAEVTELYNGGAGKPAVGGGYVVCTETGGSTAITEGGTNDTYDLKLGTQPSQDVLITATPTDAQIDLGNGAGASVILTFISTNWDTAQTVTVTAVDDDVYEGKIPHSTDIDHTTQSLDDNYNDIVVASVAVSVTDNEEICGDWGYNPRDLNHDCYVNLLDFAEFARYWLESISQ